MRPVGVVASALLVTACATAAPPARGPETSAPVPPSSSRGATPPTAPSPFESLVAPYRQRAEALERDGDLRRALEAWAIVLTIDPQNVAAREGRTRVTGLVENGVAERARQGREALGRGAQLDARRHFLAALALDPANRAAFDALRNDTRDVRFIAHTVRAGETLGTLAQRYYGDRSRSEVIWEVNQLPPNPKLAVGVTLRIPEIPGVPFVHERRERPPVEPAPRPGGAPPKEEITQELNPLFEEAREAYERREFRVALADVEKLLAGNPRHTEGLDLKKAVLYNLGKAQLEEKNFDESYQTLSQLARLAPSYEDAPKLLQQVRTRLIQHHYSQGLQYYRQERLEDAIAEWRVVLGLDAKHPSAQRNIDQAERILKRLEQRRKP